MTLRTFIVQVGLVATSAVLALFLVKVFDDWYQDTEERRARRRSRAQHPSSSGPRHE